MHLIGDVNNGKRNSGIDLIRGLLVLAVILGHFSEITQRQSLMTWLGTGLRMPVFMGLAGYLFKLEIARAGSLPHLLCKYQRRIIVPWLVASIVYLTISKQISILTPLLIFFQPKFHLWFVPVMMAYIIIATINRRSPLGMLAIAIPASMAAMYLLGLAHQASQMSSLLPERRFFIYPIYFFYGLWVASSKPDIKIQRIALALAPIGIMWWCTLYQGSNLPAEAAAQIISCVSLISLLPLIRKISFSVPSVAVVGRDSLFFYLWHPLVFSLWSACGLAGFPILILSMLTLVLSHALCRLHSSIARIMGLSPSFTPAKTSVENTFP